jgi:hypothetical protein
MTPITERAWAAGFYDGEGSTHATTNGASLQISIAQVDARPLRRFASAVGEENGLIRVVPARGPISRRAVHVLRLYGDRAIGVLQVLWPFLSEQKRDQALTALSSYGWRSVAHRGGLRTCGRGHDQTQFAPYRSSDGSGECSECRRLRRSGPLARASRITAIEAGVAVRQYSPASFMET